MIDVLDIRQLADEWRDLLKDEEQSGDTDIAELAKYTELCDQLGVEPDPDSLESYGDNYEPTLIAEHSFTEYAQELAEEIGAINADANWPLSCIDWERAARDLAMDYSTVTFDGTDYLIRS